MKTLPLFSSERKMHFIYIDDSGARVFSSAATESQLSPHPRTQTLAQMPI